MFVLSVIASIASIVPAISQPMVPSPMGNQVTVGAAQGQQSEKINTRVAIADATKRIEALETRLEHITEQITEPKKEEPSIAQQLLHFGASVFEKAFADMVGFATLAFIFAWMIKRELIRTVHEGMEKIGTIFAGSFVSSVVPELINFRRDAISVLQSKYFFYVQPGDIEAPLVVDSELGKIQELIDSHKLAEAENALIQLSGVWPKELKIVNELYNLYDSRAFENNVGTLQAAQKALQFIESKESQFNTVPEYYMLLARANCKFEGTGPSRQYYAKALRAASAAIAIASDNPRWLSLRGLVHDAFNVVVDAVKDTEAALGLAMTKGDEKNIARAKNNLAFYYAELGQSENKDIALQYAKEACEYDRKHGAPIHISIDTLGYVLMIFGESKEELERAVTLLGEAVAGDPQDAEITSHLSEAQKRLETFNVVDC